MEVGGRAALAEEVDARKRLMRGRRLWMWEGWAVGLLWEGAAERVPLQCGSRVCEKLVRDKFLAGARIRARNVMLKKLPPGQLPIHSKGITLSLNGRSGAPPQRRLLCPLGFSGPSPPGSACCYLS